MDYPTVPHPAAHLYTDGHTTLRLTTRWLQAGHIPLWQPFFEHEPATRFIPTLGQTTPLGRATAWIERQQTRYARQLLGMQALHLKTDGTFIGMCGLMWHNLGNETYETEVGYHLLPAFWGQGYATEAARKFIDVALQTMALPSVISVVAKANTASAAVAQRNGLLPERELTFAGFDTLVYPAPPKFTTQY